MKKSLINKYLRKFGIELHGTGYMQSLQKSSFSEDAFDKQKEILGRNATVIFDIGANRGEVTLKYKSLFSSAAIYAFEPFSGSFGILQSRIQGLHNIHTFQKAISDSNGTFTFYVNKNIDTNSLLKSQKMGLNSDSEVRNISSIQVETITIDEFCVTNNIKEIDILKLDIQGGELAALKGAEKLLALKKIHLIYTEAYFKQQYEQQPLFFEIATFLQEHNYYLQDLYNPIYGKGSIAWCDAIFLPKV